MVYFGGIVTERKEEIMTNKKPEVEYNSRYSPKEAAFMLGISISTLYKHTKLGNILCGFYKHNGRRFYRGSDIVKFWGSEY